MVPPERAQLASEPADKPGSVPRQGRGGGHPSGTTVARRLVQPTRRSTGASSPDLPTADRRQDSLLLGLAPGGGCPADRVTTAAGALLPHRFTLAGRADPPLGRDLAGNMPLCCPLPPDHSAWPLASTVLLGARTFLGPVSTGPRPPGRLERQLEGSTPERACQDPARGGRGQRSLAPATHLIRNNLPF